MKFKILFFAILSIFWTGGNTVASENPRQIQYKLIAAGDASTNLPLKPGHTWFKERSEFETFIRKYLPKLKIVTSEIDFDVGNMLFFNMGEESYGPRSIGILNLINLGESAALSYTTLSHGCIQTWSVTHPYKLIFIESKMDNIEVSAIDSKEVCNR